MQSVHTTSFSYLLDELQASLLVTTYQAGKLLVLRNGSSGVLNTHFRNLSKPMGLAYTQGKLAIGCNVDIWEFHNVPAVCGKLDQSTNGEKHDACFLPRRSHCTGDIQIHEMTWDQEDLVFVNTAFSCLSRRSDRYSFEPIWRPKFINCLLPGDNCHLNGLATREGQVKYVTALGETNTPGGWRENKRSGGIVIDVEWNEIVTRDLCMPHSPRWHRDRLWLLESGDGTIGWVDAATGRYHSVAQLPGFTRGLSFLGPWAFVGLSMVRESAWFSGIPLAERQEVRDCGVWIVNIDSGETVAFCKFEEGVQEIFAVELLTGIRFPDLVNHDLELVSHSYVLDEAALADVPDEFRS